MLLALTSTGRFGILVALLVGIFTLIGMISRVLWKGFSLVSAQLIATRENTKEIKELSKRMERMERRELGNQHG
jgi:hypothetical protein